MSKCWIIGKRVTLATNGHEYMAEPYIVFHTEQSANEACDLVEKISGERPMKYEASLYEFAARPIPRERTI